MEARLITLADLLAEIGNDRLSFQMLGHSLHGDQKLVGRGKELMVSFLTSPSNLDLSDLVFNRPMKRNALIVWADSCEIDGAMDRLKARRAKPMRTGPDGVRLLRTGMSNDVFLADVAFAIQNDKLTLEELRDAISEHLEK